MTPETPSPRRPLAYPDWAVVRRTATRADRREGPGRIANRGAAVLAALRDGAARIAAGDRELVRSLRPAVGTSARGLAAVGGHYLPPNRLDWWGKTPWASGAIDRNNPTSGAEDAFTADSSAAFLCEFNPAVATIVGSRVADGTVERELQPYHRIPWQGAPGSSPNAVPDI